MKKLIPADSILIPDNASEVFSGQIFSVYQWPQAMYDGSIATFEMLKRADTVNVICIVDGKIIMLDDEQPNRSALKTFPGGRVDPEDDSTLAGAQREVLEEVGFSFANWRLIKVEQPAHKIEWFSYLYLAQEVIDQQEPHLDAGEKISSQMIGFDELKQLVTARDGFLGDCYEVFENLHNLDDLLALPAYEGQEIDR